MALSAVTAQASCSDTSKPMTQAEIQATYQSCPVGYGHVIYLPEPFINKIRQVDKQGDAAVRAMLKQAQPQVFREPLQK